jgi:large subunit ribosomal protein L33
MVRVGAGIVDSTTRQFLHRGGLSVDARQDRITEMAQKETRIIITMACTECRSRNYTTSKNRIKHQNRLELKKYCNRPTCRRHTLHREAK